MFDSEQNSLLRSAFQIAQRKGKETNWEVFENKLKEELKRQADYAGDDEQSILRVTCTPLTFRQRSTG